MITRENRLEPIQFEILNDVVDPLKIKDLKKFIDSLAKNKDSNLTSSLKIDLPNKIDELDPDGTIMKLQSTFREYLKGRFFLMGQLEPRVFVAMRTSESSGYAETFEKLDADSQIQYTAIIPLSEYTSDYKGGEILYTVSGEGFHSKVGTMIVHRNELENSWSILPTTSGYRLDLVFMHVEEIKNVTYEDFTIDQSVDDGIDY